MSLFSRLASEPPRTSGCGGGGIGVVILVGCCSCSDMLRRIAPTIRAAWAASSETCFLADHILYDVARAWILPNRSAGLLACQRKGYAADSTRRTWPGHSP